MLEHLVEDLRRRQSADQVFRGGRDHRLVDLGAPAVAGQRVRDGLALLLLEPCAEAEEIVDQPTCLVLLCLEAGQPEQLVTVMAGLRDAGRDPKPGALVGRDQLDLVHVEPELVEATQPGATR